MTEEIRKPAPTEEQSDVGRPARERAEADSAARKESALSEAMDRATAPVGKDDGE